MFGKNNERKRTVDKCNGKWKENICTKTMYTFVISFFLTDLKILIVRALDMENDNEIENNDNDKTKGKVKTIAIICAKWF